MTKEQLENLVPRMTIVYAKRDGVGYTFMGVNPDGKYQLCGLPFGYDDDIMMNSFEIRGKK